MKGPRCEDTKGLPLGPRPVRARSPFLRSLGANRGRRRPWVPAGDGASHHGHAAAPVPAPTCSPAWDPCRRQKAELEPELGVTVTEGTRCE